VPGGVSDRPTVLISSSFDLKEARSELDLALKRAIQARGALLETFRWEDETDGGSLLNASSPIQRQIDKVLDNRITWTLVMFGERIGVELHGEVPDRAKFVLEQWRPSGLVHPWPADLRRQRKLLATGKFPLTGTVYELLVGLRNEECLIGYVANRDVTSRVRLDQMVFNKGALFRREVPSEPNMAEQDKEFRAEQYDPQVQGLLNLLKALVRKGKNPVRYEDASQMAARMASACVQHLKKHIPDRTGQLPFKYNMEPYGYRDDLPIPDREDLRRKLKTDLLYYGRQGEMLVLEGPSGCGKSSLLQKGLLDDLHFDLAGAQVVVFRPTDMHSRQETTPFLKLMGLIAEALEPHGLPELAGIRRPKGRDGQSMAEAAASAIDAALTRARTQMVLAVDQFEEVVDLADLERSRRDTTGSWWQALRFLGAAAQRKTIFVVGTLEITRASKLPALDLRQYAGLTVRAEDVDFPLVDVRDFVRHTASVAGLPMSDDLIDDIYRMVQHFEWERAGNRPTSLSASFLPLLAIWLHRLFVRFQDRMGHEAESATESFRATNELTRDDLQRRDIKLELAPLIGEMVEAAWQEAGQLEDHEVGRRLDILDEGRLRAFIDMSRRNPRGSALVKASTDKRRRFDVRRFWMGLSDAGRARSGIAEVLELDRRPDPVVMDAFLNSLVSVEGGESLRLLDISRQSPFHGMASLIAAHEKRRLLVPAGPRRLRLVHQAVLDHWGPGSRWLAKRTKEVALLLRMESLAEAIGNGGDTVEQCLARGPEALHDAVRLLARMRATWTNGVESLTVRDTRTRQICLDLVGSAPNGAETVSTGDDARTVAYEAARYNLAAPLDRWLQSDPSLLDSVSTSRQATLLHAAAWGASASVRVLLKHGARIVVPDVGGWHPIAESVEIGNAEIFEQLFSAAYTSGCDEIGPMGITLLHEAARAANPAILQRLLATSRADVRDQQGEQPLHYAADRGRIAQGCALLGCCDPTVPDNSGSTALHNAAIADQGAWIAALLDDGDLLAAHRELLLTKPDVSGMTPLCVAAWRASPSALSTLLTYGDPSDPHHRANAMHPLVLLIAADRGTPRGESVTERVSDCARMLLEDERLTPQRLTPQDVAHARAAAAEYPDVQRMIDDWLVRNGSFEGISHEVLFSWLVGSRTDIAVTVLRKSAGILDAVDEDGVSGAALLLGKGHVRTIAAALEHGVEPLRDSELFRFEAALRLMEASAAFPTRPVAAFHPLIRRFRAGKATQLRKVLMGMLRGAGSASGLLHRLALVDHEAAFAAVVAGLRGPICPDAYGRAPSAVAPRGRRRVYAGIEKNRRFGSTR